MIEREANEQVLPLRRAPQLPGTRKALAAADWVWRDRRAFPQTNRQLFAAHFVLGEDAGDRAGTDDPVSQSGTDGEMSAVAEDRGAAGGGAPRGIIGRESAFQARLRSWLLSD